MIKLLGEYLHSAQIGGCILVNGFSIPIPAGAEL